MQMFERIILDKWWLCLWWWRKSSIDPWAYTKMCFMHII